MDYSNLPRFVNAMPLDDEMEAQQVKWILEKFGTEKAHGSAYINLANRAQTHGFYSWYVEHDLAALKQWFYLASRLRAESTKIVGGWDIWTPHDFIFPLFVNSGEKLIQMAE